MEASLELAGTSDSDHNRCEKKPITRHKRPNRSSSAASSSSGGDCSFSSSGEATEEEEDMANCLILLARGTCPGVSAAEAYECKTCNRAFPSFQALGGHRASHKKPRTDDRERKTKPVSPVPNKEPSEETPRHENHRNDVLVFSSNKRNSPGASKVHECSVCGSEFTSGQALGGHMRRHRAAMSAASFGDAMTRTPSLLPSDGNDVTKRRCDNILALDLNLPAPEDDGHRNSPEMQFGFVFPARPALVGCHY